MDYITSLSDNHPNWVDVDIEKVCRICLQSDNDLVLIFDELNSYNKICLADMITECSNCRVERHDDYPHQICLKCIEALKSAYIFRLKCKQSHKIAKLALNNGKEPRIPIIDNDNLPPLDKFTQTEALSFFPCEKCDEKFITIEKLRTHRYYNHKGTSHECRVCNKSFRRIGYLKNHLAFYHPELGHVNNNECPICFKKFGRTEHLRRHQVKVHNQKFGNPLNNIKTELSKENILNDDTIKKHVCQMCSTICETEDELTNHFCRENFEQSIKSEEINIHVNQENHFENDVLDLPISEDQSDEDDLKPLSKLKEVYEFERKDELNATNKREISENKEKLKSGTQKKSKIEHLCNICKKTFTRADHLRRHERSHLNIKPYNCIHCNKTFSRSDHLNNHMTKSHSEKQPFKCEKCNKGFPRMENLLRHQSQCSSEQEHNPKVKNPKSYKCEICQKGFTTERHHRVHVNNHSSKIFSCKFCKLVHKTKAESVEHLKTHDNQKPFLCSECGLRFVRNDYLIVHMRRHNGEKPYKCKFCDKGFPRATDLTVHERYHTGEKSHLCVTCGKGFHRAYNLVVHMRVHTGERPYKCPHCSKSFAQGNDLKAHIRRHTGERFRCEICNEGFIQGYHLTQHKKAAHGIDQPSHIRRLEKITPNRTDQKQQIEELMNQIVEGEEIKDEPSNCVNTIEDKANDYASVTFLDTNKGINISGPIFYTTNIGNETVVKYETNFE